MELELMLNARFQPIHRHDLEDALQLYLEQKEIGEVTGGGTTQNQDGEIESCDIQIYLNDENEDDIKWLVDLLNKIGIPKGSVLQIDSDYEIEVGTLEGLACYLNGTDLPADVYQTCDINYAIEQLELSIKNTGRMYSYWESNKYTALYFYGTSFCDMKKKMKAFIESYPLCQKCRIEQIA